MRQSNVGIYEEWRSVATSAQNKMLELEQDDKDIHVWGRGNVGNLAWGVKGQDMCAKCPHVGAVHQGWRALTDEEGWSWAGKPSLGPQDVEVCPGVWIGPRERIRAQVKWHPCRQGGGSRDGIFVIYMELFNEIYQIRSFPIVREGI